MGWKPLKGCYPMSSWTLVHSSRGDLVMIQQRRVWKIYERREGEVAKRHKASYRSGCKAAYMVMNVNVNEIRLQLARCVTQRYYGTQPLSIENKGAN